MSAPTEFHRADLPSFRYMGRNCYTAGMAPDDAIMIHPDGRMEIVKQDATTSRPARPYESTHPRSLSLTTCIGDDKAVSIAFTGGFQLPIEFEKLKKDGHWSVEDWSFPLYHDYVLWNYSVRLNREEGNKYSLSVVSRGSHMGEPKKDGLSNNLPGLGAPPILRKFVVVADKANYGDTPPVVVYLDIDPSGHGDFISSDTISEEKLRVITASGHMYVRPMFFVPRSYFSLSSIIDLKPEATVPAFIKSCVETILRREKWPGYDWEITGGCECDHCENPPVYYVHKKTFAKASAAIKAAVNTGRDGAHIELLNGGKRCNLGVSSGHGLRLAIQIAYGVEVSLPERSDYTKELIQRLHALFGDHFTKVVIPQWERDICRKVLAMDKRHPSSSMAQLLHLLDIIWSAPYGWMPVAKRVAIGTLADMAHLTATSSLQQWIQESIIPHVYESKCENEHVGLFLNSFYKMMNRVSGVEKMSMDANGKFLDPSLNENREEERVEEEGEEEETAEDEEEEELAGELARAQIGRSPE